EVASQQSTRDVLRWNLCWNFFLAVGLYLRADDGVCVWNLGNALAQGARYEAVESDGLQTLRPRHDDCRRDRPHGERPGPCRVPLGSVWGGRQQSDLCRRGGGS